MRRTKEAESANAALAADHNRITIEEATALLEAASAGEKIAAERERDFARAVLERDEMLAGMRNRGYSVKFTGENRA